MLKSCNNTNLYVGELVAWINQDINFPREVKSQNEILTYFRNHPCPENIQVASIK
ncbi:YozE family protein, partial [Staphylococcus saccharolyticus]